jgi:hypothetical protein
LKTVLREFLGGGAVFQPLIVPDEMAADFGGVEKICR